MIVEMGKEYVTESGKPARVIAMDGGGEFPIVALIGNDDAVKSVRFFKINGKSASYNCDLVEVKPRIKGEFWLAHLSREQVVALTEYPCATHTVWNVEPIAITHHTYDCEEGEGLK